MPGLLCYRGSVRFLFKVEMRQDFLVCAGEPTLADWSENAGESSGTSSSLSKFHGILRMELDCFYITSYMNTRHPISLKRKGGCLGVVYKYRADEYIGLQQLPFTRLVIARIKAKMRWIMLRCLASGGGQ